ncbi:MAG TPA: biotin-independent malonate decarboxylase subunit beta [Acidobacteriaceae bacterium]|jgi:malonate decarboxylase beta subunit
MSESTFVPSFVNRRSFIELDGRARAQSLLDEGTGKELVGPFDRIESPWLPMQDVAPQADDGCIVMKGRIAGNPAVVISLEGAFQGGSIGEVSGAKMTAALDLATRDSSAGIPTAAVLLLETGGVRLQEANLGLAAMAEVIASILSLRQHAPVITVVAGTVGCFGGMSLAAGVSSYVVMTREARLGLNGPEVIEQESGIEEFDASDRALIWAIHGGEQRVGMGLADALVEDSIEEIESAVRRYVLAGRPAQHRSEQVQLYRERIAAIDTSKQIDPSALREQWSVCESKGGAG